MTLKGRWQGTWQFSASQLLLGRGESNTSIVNLGPNVWRAGRLLALSDCPAVIRRSEDKLIQDISDIPGYVVYHLVGQIKEWF